MPFKDYITDEAFKEFKGNKYILVNLAAMRARQINDGVEVYVRVSSKHPLQTALEEIAAGFVDFSLGADDTAAEQFYVETDLISFDEMINLEGDFDFDDEEAFDLEPLDEFDDEFTAYDEVEEIEE